MIIVHEGMPEEASKIGDALKIAYGFDSVAISRDIQSAFISLPEFCGFWGSSSELESELREYAPKKVLVLTARDIYFDNVSKSDDWVLGYNTGNLSVVSTARLKRYDGEPSDVLQVPKDRYIKRLQAMAIHEIGHDVIKSPKFKIATWVNAQTGHTLWLGPHCTDNTCVMYEIVDIRAPNNNEGYMLLGEEKKFDAGLDDVLGRINPDWLCGECRSHTRIDDSYI